MEATGLPVDKLLTQRKSLREALQLLHRRTLLALGQTGPIRRVTARTNG